jgi:hypothetical protein
MQRGSKSNREPVNETNSMGQQLDDQLTNKSESPFFSLDEGSVDQ